jgi:hypothetical protein
MNNGRFAQADTIIPGGAQGMDRYADANNNAMKYTDPSGHGPCWAGKHYKCNLNAGQLTSLLGNKKTEKFAVNYMSGNDCIYKSGDLCVTYTDLLKHGIQKNFGVTTTGNWSSQNIHILSDALWNINNRIGGTLSQYTQGATFSFSYDPQHYGGVTALDGSGIAFHSYNALPYQLIYHEVGHQIDIRTGDYFSNTLNNRAVYTNTEPPEFVMGGPKEKYNRNSIGYKSVFVNDPNFGSIRAEMHSNSYCPGDPGWCVSGNTASEEFADVFGNHVSGNLDINRNGSQNSEFGWARFNWLFTTFANYARITQ